MNKEILYNNKIPLRLLFVFELVFGPVLLYVFINSFLNENYLSVWTIAGPLLGLAIFITGLTGSKIKEIKLNSSNKSIEIKRETLFKSKIKQIDAYNINVALKTDNGKKSYLNPNPKLRLIFLNNDKEVDELESGFLSINNVKLNKLYSVLKSIVKITNANKA